MIVGIGCDMVDHSMSRWLSWDTDEEVLHRIFSQSELNIYQAHKSIAFLAGRFAAKEAVLKCLGTGMLDGMSMVDIQILKNTSGLPTITLEGSLQHYAEELGIDVWHVSISHSTNSSIAYVIAEHKS